MHWAWKNFPLGFAGQYKGKEKKPTMVLEAVASKNLQIWHAFLAPSMTSTSFIGVTCLTLYLLGLWTQSILPSTGTNTTRVTIYATQSTHLGQL
jgi:hypothetical protein